MKIIILNNICIFVLFLISSNNCFIEIPIKPIKIKDIQKNKIKNKASLKYSGIKNLNKTLYIIEEQTILNSDLMFLASIKLGSNNQTFKLLLDTGSYISWVAKNGSNDYYKINNHYYPSKSNTSYKTDTHFVQTFSSGNCSGYFYTDNLKFLNKIIKIKIGVADNTHFYSNSADGIIGLSHYYEDESYSFIHILKQNNIIDSKSFSFKYKEDILDGLSGKLILGKHTDFSNKEAVTCPLINLSGNSKKFWACEISSFGMEYNNQKKDLIKSHNIIFDTGSDKIILPESYYKNLHFDHDCGLSINRDNSFKLYCSYDKRVDFRIKINGNIFILKKDLFFYKYEYDNSITYYSKIIFHEDTCVMGIPFFLAFHTLFDKEKEKLHFYPENKNYIEKDDKNDKKSGNDTLIIIIAIPISIIIIVGAIVYPVMKWRRSKREQNGFITQNNCNYSNNFL